MQKCYVLRFFAGIQAVFSPFGQEKNEKKPRAFRSTGLVRAEVSGLAAPGTFPASAGAGNGGTRRVGMFERRGTLSGMGFSATERVHTAYVVWVDSGCSMCRSGVSYARNTIESKAAEMPRKKSTAAHGYHGGGGVFLAPQKAISYAAVPARE